MSCQRQLHSLYDVRSMLQVLTVFFGSFIAGSFLNQLTAIIHDPSYLISILGDAAPQVAVFFMTYLLLMVRYSLRSFQDATYVSEHQSRAYHLLHAAVLAPDKFNPLPAAKCYMCPSYSGSFRELAETCFQQIITKLQKPRQLPAIKQLSAQYLQSILLTCMSHAAVLYLIKWTNKF